MGVLGTFRDAVTVVNRTIGAGDFETELTVRYDGEDIVLKPGANHGFPRVAVPYARKQNPLKGSMSPINPAKFISLVGCKEMGYEETPISQETLAKAAGKYEVLDRSGEFHDEPMRKVKLLRKRGFDAFEAQVEGGIGSDLDGALSAKLG